MTDIKRFEQWFVRENGCWVWFGQKDKGGYGVFWFYGKQCRAHRASHELYAGLIPAGMCVLHRCDNPACVNPDHLFIGTRKDNTQDMLRKGRWARAHPNARRPHRLSAQDALYIFNSGETNVSLSKKFGLHRTTISDIKRGYIWGWLTGKPKSSVDKTS